MRYIYSAALISCAIVARAHINKKTDGAFDFTKPQIVDNEDQIFDSRLFARINDTDTKPPSPCPSTWKPVCGSNGITYENSCVFGELADESLGVKIEHEGECHINDKCDDSCQLMYDGCNYCYCNQEKRLYGCTKRKCSRKQLVGLSKRNERYHSGVKKLRTGEDSGEEDDPTDEKPKCVLHTKKHSWGIVKKDENSEKNVETKEEETADGVCEWVLSDNGQGNCQATCASLKLGTASKLTCDDEVHAFEVNAIMASKTEFDKALQSINASTFPKELSSSASISCASFDFRTSASDPASPYVDLSNVSSLKCFGKFGNVSSTCNAAVPGTRGKGGNNRRLCCCSIDGEDTKEDEVEEEESVPVKRSGSLSKKSSSKKSVCRRIVKTKVIKKFDVKGRVTAVVRKVITIKKKKSTTGVFERVNKVKEVVGKVMDNKTKEEKDKKVEVKQTEINVEKKTEKKTEEEHKAVKKTEREEERSGDEKEKPTEKQKQTVTLRGNAKK